jgi:glycosyltransferase involved in cell wall biosynthesis
MRIALVNEGTYPYATGGVSTWCDHLVRGLPEVDYHLMAIVAVDGARPALALPDNVRSLTTAPLWDPARPASRSGRRRAVRAAALLFEGMLGDTAEDIAAFEAGLRALAAPTRPRGRHPLAEVSTVDPLLAAWARARDRDGAGDGPPLPRLTLRDAAEVAMLVEHALRPLAVALPEVELCHANANGLSSLVALATKWRTGTPFVMTEHGVYLRERYLGAVHATAGVKAAMLRFHRALARLAYAEADLIAPVTSFNRRWAVRHGADPAKVVVVANGVDPARFAPLHDEPDAPVISWIGRIDPLKDLHTLIRALPHIRATVPDARLHLAGPVPPGNAEYAQSCRSLAADLGLSGAVDFVGPVANSRNAFAAGRVAALSSISEGMPYTVIEAMMCARATVSTDVGGVAETVGDTGVVVPPRDPAAFGAACAALLTDTSRRRALAAGGRARAVARYTLDRCLSAYRDLYAQVA